MKKIVKSILALSLLTVISANAQSGDVGIGTTTPNASAALDVTSTTKGLLMPRMTSTQRAAVATPAAGLQVYDTTTNTIWYHNGTAWVNNGSAAIVSKWTNDASNTRVALTNLSNGTTARTAGTEMVVTDAGNVGIGTATPTEKLEIVGNTNIYPTTNATNVATAKQLTVGETTNSAGYKLSMGYFNDGAWKSSIQSTDGGVGTTLLLNGNGGSVGIGTTSPLGAFQVGGAALGFLRVNTGTATNTAYLEFWNGGSTSSRNGYIGYGNSATTGSNTGGMTINTEAGPLVLNNTGQNVGIGTLAPNAQLQLGNSTVNRKIVLYENVNNDNEFYGFGINSSILRYQVSALDADHVFYSGIDASSSKELMRIKGDGLVGIGTSTPTEKLDVTGSIKMVDGNQAAGAFMVSDANGKATWTSAATALGVSASKWTNDASNTRVALTKLSNGTTARTAGTEMVVTDAGNVGIGTATPGYKLDVRGTGFFSTDGINGVDVRQGGYGGISSVGTNNPLVINYNNNQQTSLNFASSGNVDILNGGTGRLSIGHSGPLGIFDVSTSGANGWSYFRSNSFTNPSASFNFGIALGTNRSGGNSEANLVYAETGGLDVASWDGATYTNRLRIAPSTGNVGIGTFTPNAQLQLSNSVGNRKLVLYESQNDDHQFYGFGINSAIMRYQVSGAGASHVFYSGINTSSSRELMRIVGNGLVGIGTASPGAALDIRGTDWVSSSLIIGNATANEGQILNFVGDARSYALGTWNSGGSAPNTFFIYDNTIGAPRVAVGPSGNVGIGSIAPTSKLQVVGLTIHVDNAAAITAGLTAGAFYHNGDGVVRVVF